MKDYKKIFYDFEVFKEDWMVCFYDYDNKKSFHVINSKEDLRFVFERNEDSIWIGYNNTYYDQYIFKSILLDIDPKEINDLIIVEKENPKFVLPKNDIKMYNFDLSNKFRGLKELEGFMGSKIKESGVDFNINRKLTEVELEEVLEYCQHDVMETVNVYENLKEELDSQILMIETFDLSMEKFENTKAKLSAFVLGANKPKYPKNDEFNLSFPDTLVLDKYKYVLDWYKEVSNRDYKKKFVTDISGVPHIFAWGGIHGAIPSYIEEGEFIMSDIASMYPALMIEYDYLSRNVKEKEKYREIRDKRIILKKKKDPTQLPLKIVLNSTYGAMKDKYNDLYDPLMANNVCIGGQLLLLDLIEKVEPYCTLVQSNTDGILVKIDSEENKKKYFEICDEWCKRSRLDLEHDKYVKVIQKDVNNYIIVDEEGKYKSKGAYVKKLNKIDYDLPIVNESLIEYFINGTPVEKTILECDEFIKFQKIVKLTGKYRVASHNNEILKERVFRVFASNNESDGNIYKIKGEDKFEKIANTPEKCFIENENVEKESCPERLDKLYYIDIANDRIEKFKNNEFTFKIDSGVKFVGIETLTFVNDNVDKYDDFIEFYKELKNISNKREIESLIKIDKLNKFAGQIKLFNFIEYFNILKKKTFKKDKIDEFLYNHLQGNSDETAKQFKNVDKEVVVRSIWEEIKNVDISFEEKVKQQLELMGHIELEIPSSISLAKVELVSTKNRSVNLKSYRNNKTKWFKINKQLNLPNKEDILIIPRSKMINVTGWKGRKDIRIDEYTKL